MWATDLFQSEIVLGMKPILSCRGAVYGRIGFPPHSAVDAQAGTVVEVLVHYRSPAIPYSR
jgi:hypothetical protein